MHIANFALSHYEQFRFCHFAVNLSLFDIRVDLTTSRDYELILTFSALLKDQGLHPGGPGSQQAPEDSGQGEERHQCCWGV